jgi:hypothetical protein
MFPSNTNCTATAQQWNKVMDGEKNYNLWENAAVLQYANNEKARNEGK